MGYRTPNIDRIAREGMMFTDYYAEQSCTAGGRRSSPANARCAPAFQGGHSGRDRGSAGARCDAGRVAQAAGYATGQFGKNHLGDKNEYLPTVHGFDEFYGNLYHLNAEEDPESRTYPRDPAFRQASVRAAFCAARPPTATIRPISRAGARSASRPSRTPARSPEAHGDDRRRNLSRRHRFHQRQVRANTPFFCWFNSTRHALPHPCAGSPSRQARTDGANRIR
jgi:arylsulfatase